MSATKSEAIEGYRLSPQQTRLWHVLQCAPACGVARVCLSLQGSPRPLVIERALHLLVSRHSILRTTYLSTLQVISPETIVTFDVCDLSGLESQEEASALEQLAVEAACSDTEPEAPPVNALLVTFSEHDHHLWINLPSLTADTRSLNNLAREFMRCYESCAKATALTDEPLDYLQFSEWQNELLLDVEQAANGREYWRQMDQLRFRQTVSKFKPAVVGVSFTRAEVEQIGSANAWLGCWEALLWSTSGAREVGLGYVSEGRRYAEMNDGLGLYAKWLPIVVEVEPERGLREIVRDAGDAVRAAEEQQDYFVLEGEHRFFGIGYEYEERWEGAETVGVHFSVSEQQVELEPYELKLHCVKENGRVRAELRYDAEVYEEAEVRKLADRYRRVVQHWIGNADVKLGEIAWLSDAERDEIVRQSRGEAREWGEHDVVKLFEAQVRLNSRATAIVCGDEQVSYEELNRRANQLAHYLREIGVGPEVKVGVLLPRSISMVVSVLGVLKAGAAYLPLEPQAPLPRLAYILEDAQVPVLITAETLQDGVPAHWGQTIYLDRDWDEISQRSEENPDAEISADNLAYMIYTSGSTGRPKGALITRAGLGNYLCWAVSAYPLNEGCGSPVHTPLSFDLTVTSLYTPLLSGKTVHLLREAAGAEALVEALQAGETYSLVKLTPSHLEVLRQQLTPEQADRCSRAFVIGGEALYDEQVRWWREQAPAVRLFNEYGPTETVVGCCVAEVSGAVSIGRPISNTQLYVLNEQMEVLPTGLVGEIYIGGAGVCGGYWERAELTAERYLPDPSSANGGARLYRTGDTGRYQRDGQVEYVGRLDEQVKVRGYRVELGEIEAELREQGAVREAVVMLREDQAGSKRLVAYVVADAKTTVSELRQSLQERLPEYMIPSAFVMLEELPLTVNGKVDRRALPAPDSSRPKLEKVYVAPRNEREEKLAGIWSHVLGVEKVGVHDNFFELGGDSIRSIQVVARARQQGLLISTRQLFQHQTIETLASAEQAAAGEELLLNTAPEIDSYPLSPMQQGMLYHSLYAPQSMIYTQQVSCTLKGELNVAAFERAWQQVIDRYSVLRTSFLWENLETPIQLVQPHVKLPLKEQDWQDLSPEQQQTQLEALLAADRARGFDLAQAPLMRLSLLRLSPDKYHCIWSRHHILFDGWSLPVVLQEVFAFYEAGCRGESLQLDQPRPFRDYIAWLKQQDMGRAEAYWRKELAGFSTPTRLSIERAGKTVEKQHAEQDVRLSVDQSE